MSSSGIILAPGGKLPRPAVAGLVRTRGAYQPVQPRRGGTEAFLANFPKPHEFNLGSDDDEAARLLELAGRNPGEYLMVWTFGGGLNVLLIRSGEKGTTPRVRELNLRLSPPRDVPRSTGPFHEFQNWFGHCAFRPDLAALRALYARPVISVAGWFDAFGLAGAREIIRLDSAAIWNDFEAAAGAFLLGKKLDPQQLARVYQEVEAEGEPDARLDAKASRRGPSAPRRVALLEKALTAAVGPAPSARWKERKRAAAYYWDITDSPAAERLTVGADKKGLGASASLGRLLGHYPAALARDGLLWALAAAEAEAAEGQVFVPSLESLARHAPEAGFTLIVYQAAHEDDFREEFGIAESGESTAQNGWAAEAFLDVPEILKAEPRAVLAKWFAREKADGVLLRAEADGSWKLTVYQAGKARRPGTEELPWGGAVNRQVLTRAGSEFRPRTALAGLALPDLLEPGEWFEGAYAAHSQEEGIDEPDAPPELARAQQALARLPTPKLVSYPGELREDFPEAVRHPKETSRARVPPILVRVSVPTEDEEYLQALKKDVREACACPQTWVIGQDIWVHYTGRALPTVPLVRALGDLPHGSRIAIDPGDGQIAHYELA